MSYIRPIQQPANTKSTDYAQAIYAEQSGSTDLLCYTEGDLYSSAIPAVLGTALISGPITLNAKFLGIHCSAANSASVGVRLARSHNMAPRWSQQNTAAGVYVDAGMGAWLTAMKAAGAETIWNLFHTPTWASARPTETGDQYGFLGALAEPTSMSSLGDYVTWFMTNYGSQVDYIETWNEPKYGNTNGSYFSGTAAKLAEMARTVWVAAKAVKPSIQIMGVGSTGLTTFAGGSGPGVTETSSFLSASDGAGGFGKNWIDILSVHTYIHDGTNKVAHVPGIKGFLDTIKASNGISSMRVWASEFGFVTPLFSTYAGPAEAKLRAVARFALMNAAAGMDRCCMYGYDAAGFSWGETAVGNSEWDRWAGIINGSSITVLNKVSAAGELAAVINGQRYLV